MGMVLRQNILQQDVENLTVLTISRSKNSS